MSAFHEIVPGIHTWSEFSEEKQIEFNGYFVRGKKESVVIDPPGLEEEDLAVLRRFADSFPIKGVLLTNMHHDRASQNFKKALDVPIFINARDELGLDFKPDNIFYHRDRLFCGIEAVNFEDQKSPGETGFYLPHEKIMIVGDALIGKVPGKLNLLPPDKYADIAAAKRGLRVLMDYDFNTLLVGDGTCILSHAKHAVEESLRD